MTTPNTLPQAMQQIARSVGQATADLLTATNDVRAFLGLDLLVAGPGAPPTLGEMMGDLRLALAETVAAFGSIAGAVHTWTGTPTPTARTLAPATVDLSVEASCERAMAARDFGNVHEEYGNVPEPSAAPTWAGGILNARKAEAEPVPEPLVAPTISGGIMQPSRIDAADLDTPTTPEPEPEEPSKMPTEEEWDACVPAAPDEPEPEPTPEPDGDDETARLLATHVEALRDADTPDDESATHEPVNRVVRHLGNGTVESGAELVTVLGVEPAATGKRPRSRKKS